MPEFKLEFANFSAPARGVLVVFCDDTLKLGPQTRKALGEAADLVARAAGSERFKGKLGSALDLVAPGGLRAARLVVVGCGKARDLQSRDFVRLGGVALGKAPSAGGDLTILAELPSGAMKPDAAADIALGAQLRAYSFDRYKTKKKDDEAQPAAIKVTIGVGNVATVRKSWDRRAPIADGVVIARDLVNEPANILYPDEFAKRATALPPYSTRSVQRPTSLSIKPTCLRLNHW